LAVNRKKLKFGDWNWTLKSLIGQIRVLIVKKLKFDSELEVWFKKFKIKDQFVKDVKLQGLKLTNQGLNWKKLKVWWSIKGLSA
jgi:hypothetical protein